MVEDDNQLFLPDSVYNFVRVLALYVLPAVGSAYFALAGIWDLPNAEEVVGTITVVDTFLGAVVGFAKKRYDESAPYDGEVVLTQNDQDPDFSDAAFSLNQQALTEKRELRVRVRRS